MLNFQNYSTSFKIISILLKSHFIPFIILTLKFFNRYFTPFRDFCLPYFAPFRDFFNVSEKNFLREKIYRGYRKKAGEIENEQK